MANINITILKKSYNDNFLRRNRVLVENSLTIRYNRIHKNNTIHKEIVVISRRQKCKWEIYVIQTD